jgi:hypothetical protein
MKNSTSIPAELNIDESLRKFKESVRKSLKLEKLSEWDGERLKQIEAEIRQAGQVLVGQSIAQLLHEISQSSVAKETADKRTQGQRTQKHQGHGYRRIKIQTVGNVEVTLEIPYVVRRGGKRQQEEVEGGFYPLLSWLGMSERVSPLVWSTVSEYGMVSGSFAIAQKLLEDWGVTMSERRVERLTYRFGEIGLEQRQQQIEAMEMGNLPTGETFKGQRVVISVDGGRTRLRRNKRGKRKQSGRHGYHGDWQEPLLLTIYAVDHQGKKINTTQIPITNDGTFGHHEAFLTLLEMHLRRLGIQRCTEVLLLADGARWIWNKIPLLLQRLGCHQVTQLLDFYHATEHLQSFAEIALGADLVKSWVKKACAALKRGRVLSLINQMQAYADTAKGKHRLAILKAMQYFSKQPERFSYAQVADQKLPIGSGSIESLIRQVVNLRLKGNGKFWLPQHAEIILLGRCQWASGNWSTFCNSVLTSHLSPI